VKEYGYARQKTTARLCGVRFGRCKVSLPNSTWPNFRAPLMAVSPRWFLKQQSQKVAIRHTQRRRLNQPEQQRHHFATLFERA
jgi:hypothetical protein